MVRGAQIHLLLVGALAVVFAGFPGDSAWADSHEEGPLKIFAATDKDFVSPKTPNGSNEIAPLMALPGMSAGIVRFEKGKTKMSDWTYWYPEVLYVISGRGRVTAAAPLYTSSHTYDVGPGDFFLIPISTRIGFEALSDDPFVMFYATPYEFE